MRITRYIDSHFPGLRAPVYRLISFERYRVLRVHPEWKGVVFSFYVKTITGTNDLRVLLNGPHSSQTRDFRISEEWNRFEVSMKNDICLRPLEIFFTTRTTLSEASSIAIIFPQVEAGLLQPAR